MIRHAYWCDCDSIYAMPTPEEAAELYFRETGRACVPPYPLPLTPDEVSVPMIDECADDPVTATRLSVAQRIERGEYGYLGGYV